ncbi:MAG: amino acid permease [Gemmatimonadales bacterium]|jgi:amino acid transporter|nr:amino acid permease [Gemmatimonadales bacterium]
MSDVADTTAAPVSAKFGAFKGVFTPSILTILGVIMYLRFGWVVGHAGIVGAILIVVLAHVISFTTGMSISSIATNRTVRTGGDYFMISRSLGLPIGGAIGLALFFALALSTSLYLIGFAESFLDAFRLANTPLNRRLVGTIACVVVTGLTFVSTSLALRVQYLVLAAIGLSLVSLFASASPTLPRAELHWWFGPGSESLERVFAVFFPAVTGFTAGVAMSGDLKDPRRAIPRGTMAAILVGFAVYLAIPIFLALKVEGATLRGSQSVWSLVSRWSPLVVAGVFAATLSSALGSVLGAPRYLQALARDGVVPAILGRGYGALHEPRVGTIVTFVIAEAAILAGELDTIARVITMFFLTSYGFLCLACGVETWSGISSFRPSFRTPAWVSFLGAATCLGVMFKLDALAMGAATVVMGLIFVVLKRRQFRASPKDSWAGFWEAVVQKGVLRLHRRARGTAGWRPNALVFGGEPSERPHLVRLARWMMQDRGLATYVYLIRGDVRHESRRAQRMEPTAREAVCALYPDMLTRVTVTPDIYAGILNAAQTYGLAGMTPNTVIMGWGEESRHPGDFTELIHGLLALDHNLVMVEHDDERGFGERRSIDIWWGGLERNSQLMLLLAYLITSAEDWADAEVRVNVAVDDAAAAESTGRRLAEIIAAARIRATPNVIVRDPAARSVADLMAETSGETDLVILGLRPPGGDEGEAYVRHVGALIERLRTVLLVRASSHFDGATVLFDRE